MSETGSNELRRRLESYSDCALWIAAAKAASCDTDAPFSPERMLEELTQTKDFIISLPDCKEKLALYYRYIRGMSMEKTAELLGVSTRSIYRIRNRALSFAGKIYDKKYGEP